MTITNSIAAKAAVAFVAVAMAFTLAAPSVKAQDVSSMSLEQLIALVNQLQAQLGGSTTSTGSFSYTFTRPLGQGSTGADVLNLQKFLNLSADTQVAPAGSAGGPGSETSFYGPATAAAVSKFQTKYSADILVPSGLTSPTGYFGPASIAKANALISAGSSNGGTGTGSTGPLTGGAGDLEVTPTSRGVENDVAEGREGNVLGLELEADGSDIAITNVNLQFEVNPNSGASTRIDRYIDEAIIYLGDEEVGAIDAEDLNRDGSKYSRNVSLKNAIVREGDTERLYVAVKVSSKVDDTLSHATVTVNSLRFEDATGAIITSSGNNNNVTTWSDTFGFDAAGTDDELSIDEHGDNDDIKTTLKVDADDETDHLVLIGEMEVDDDSSDITLYTANVEVTGAASSSVEDMWVEIGNSTFDADWDGGNDWTIDFGRSGFTIDSGDSELFELYVTLAEGTSTVGDDLQFEFGITEAEGEDTLPVTDTAVSHEFTIVESEAEVKSFSWDPSSSKTTSATTTEIIFYFTVKADDKPFLVSSSSIASSSAGGAATISTAVLSWNSGDTVTGNSNTGFTVAKNKTATFRVIYTLTGTAGQYAEMAVTSVAGQKVDNDKQRSGRVQLGITNN